MKFNYALQAAQIEQLADGSFVAIRIGADRLAVGGFPSAAQLSLLVSVSAARHELGGEHRLRVGLVGPSLQVLGTMETQFRLDVGALQPAEWDDVHSFQPIVVQMPIAEPGTYLIELALNDSDRRSLRMYVLPPDPA